MKIEMNDVIVQLNTLNITKWGICDISSLHPIGCEFSAAVTMLIKYPTIHVENYNEQLFHDAIIAAKNKLNNEKKILAEFLMRNNVKHIVIPDTQDEITLLAMFPHKLGAVNSGLGWIGKSSLFITKEFGPRVRLGTILIDIKPNFTNNRCDNLCGDCNKCVDACPYHIIRGKQWEQSVKREDLFDPFACSEIREQLKKEIGHKHSCGHCLLVCPYGL